MKSATGLGAAARTATSGNVTVKRRDMSVVIYLVLTLAIFALLGLVQKLVEGL